uniref:Uncharacterized protein n=1 Tax=Chrysemys picta bellii TaxID=8478 RepID=A0A8C3HHZ4_CHRPI
MRLYSLFRSGLLLVLLCLFIAEGKKASSGKNSCRKGMISKVTENLYVKATTFKASIPKDLIKNRRLLKKTTKKLFMKNCSVRDQLLSFYVKNVFGGLGIGSDKVYIVSAFQTLQENLSNCVSIFFEANFICMKTGLLVLRNSSLPPAFLSFEITVPCHVIISSKIASQVSQIEDSDYK